jgi:hypothetical protein
MKTSSFANYRGLGRVSIARFAPRSAPSGYRVYKPLAPGSWFNSVSEQEYRLRFFAQLAELDAAQVVADLTVLAGAHEPILLCYEDPAEIARGTQYCHRRMVAEWLAAELNVVVSEWSAEIHLEPVPGQMYLL